MRIAVDTRFLHAKENPDVMNFTAEVFHRLSAAHPEHHFLFLNDTKSNDQASASTNVEQKTIHPKPTNLLSYKWWYDVKLPFALKKYKADLFVGTYGFASLTTSVPQILVVRDLAFLRKQNSSSANGLSFYRRFFSSFIKKSKAIVTLSDFVKEELVTQYNVDRKIIQTIGSGTASSFKTFDWEEREAVKEQFADGHEYFVFTGGSYLRSNFLNVLKAFSIFKKWQKTRMKLLIAGGFDAIEKDLEKLPSYKYRADVLVKRDLEQVELAKLVAASYAMIFPLSYGGFPVPVLESLKCGVPVITTKHSSMSEVAAEAGLYADPSSPEEIAEQMKKVFKDERLRNELIEAAKMRSEYFSWDKTAALLGQVVEQVVSK
ncbi:glycosyltransferase family 4 protein [Segetibacter aerophilus]|uniref:Glycosyl transferase family 1 n=1 Tax=Segetibacter aerophilus TaxID=670293 RepID=A0A512BEX4_9BACT|nr:glycosyltransferase family 1 protein [Segetibacter aerophilus]GEO10526.1 glycosyl transferase family 1 [Segetibacter aerophilus]